MTGCHWRVADDTAAASGLSGSQGACPAQWGFTRGPCSGPAAAARLWPVDLDDILDGPPTDGAAGPGLPLEPQATAVAQAHVSARVDDRVHLAVEAHRALTVLAACWLRGQESRGHWGAQRGAGGCHQG